MVSAMETAAASLYALAAAFFSRVSFDSLTLSTGGLGLSSAVKLGLRVALTTGLGLRAGVGGKSGRGDGGCRAAWLEGDRATSVSVLERRCSDAEPWLPRRLSSSLSLLLLLLALRVLGGVLLVLLVLLLLLLVLAAALLLAAAVLLLRKMSNGRSVETLLPRRLR